MSDSVTTRIKLPAEVHREVKAQAVYHDVKLAEALGMCVAFLCQMTTPLVWLNDHDQAAFDVAQWASGPPSKK